MNQQKTILDKYVESKYYIEVERKVESAYGGEIWQYTFSVMFMHQKVFNKLRRIERKEGYLRVLNVEKASDERIQDNGWMYSLVGTYNGASPFEHSEITKDLESIIR